MPCTAARLADVPAIVLSNFTWDWIYEDFTSDHEAFASLPPRLGARYAEADAAWRLPMYGGFDTFRTVLDFPWVARRSTHDRDHVRRLIGVDDTRPLVLVSFGGYGVAGMTLAHHDQAPYRLVWSGGAQHGPTTAPDDALRLDRDHLGSLGLRYEDLVAAVDVVVSKPGYGIVSECVANGAALLYTDRGRFREYPVMVEQMPQVLRCRHIPTVALTRDRWDDDIEALLAQPPPAARPLVNGADVAAGMLSAMVDSAT
jgi:L-arabinokinase